MKRLIVNLVAFQIGWWATVLNAAYGALWLAVAVVAAVLVIYFLTAPHRTRDLWLLPVAALLGMAADAGLAAGGVLQFAPAAAIGVLPIWVALLWLNFVTLIDGALRLLQQRLAFAAVLGAVSGPLAYLAGVAFGLVEIGAGWVGYLVLAGAWAAVLAAQFALARVTEPAAAEAAAAETATPATEGA